MLGKNSKLINYGSFSEEFDEFAHICNKNFGEKIRKFDEMLSNLGGHSVREKLSKIGSLCQRRLALIY